MRWIALLMFGLAGCSRSNSPATPDLETSPVQVRTLSNGLRAAVIHFSGSTNVSLFTFVPMGLLADGPGQTQWAHLVEHLVIRTTIPDGSPVGNAETMGDHMRLDWYGNTNQWREGLEHHRRWLTGLPLTAENLKAETPKVLFETDYTQRNLATHKFALAAWNQGVRHRRPHAAVRGDVTSAALGDVQTHRDQHLAVLTNSLICLVGGVSLQEGFAALESELSEVRSAAGPPAAPSELAPGDVEMTWDLGVRHLVLTWPMPPVGSPDYAALWLGAQLLMMRYSMDATLDGVTGPALAGADFITPEQRYFYVTAALRPTSDAAQAREKLLSQVKKIGEEELPALQLEAMRTQAAQWMRAVPDPKVLHKQAPQVAMNVLEGNLALQWATQRYRHLGHHTQLADELEAVDGKMVRAAAVRHLGVNQVRTCLIRPVHPN